MENLNFNSVENVPGFETLHFPRERLPYIFVTAKAYFSAKLRNFAI